MKEVELLMEGLAKLVSAFAALLWPVFAFIFLWMFKPQISEALRRIGQLRKWKGFGQEIELDDELKKLEQATEKAQKEIVPAPSLSPPKLNVAEKVKIILEATKSPKAALILLGPEIEQRLRQLLSATGWQQHIGPKPFIDAVEQLRKQGSLPANISGSLKLFSDIRNRLIHGREATDDDIFRAIDSGLTLLQAIESIPAEINIVKATDVTLYRDANGTEPITDAKGVILETTSPGGASKSLRIYPTTRKHFQVGRRVAWEWNLEKKWGRAWYRDPETREIKEAWREAGEFIGRHLDDV